MDIICLEDMLVLIDSYYCMVIVVLFIFIVEDGCFNIIFSVSVSVGYFIVVDGVFIVY